ncbi:hypothetical protein [Rossellomorea aquimaris]|uniref:NrS-1 polymerase-like HBD domain-containing protein n=1 Tax=Rossellomorea aquimaris TaxID=189382 RepID=A0A366EFV5_9BACI|nr:hypothetical protein [Rossellomorea aquimaris]RBP01213.1 hypothetical protein DET59_12014 [Rossellomorea aquimaris]
MALRLGDKIPAPDFEKVPFELKKHRQWLLWQARPEKGKPGIVTKEPVTLEGEIFYGWNNPTNLYSFAAVQRAFQTGKFSGVGFVLASTDLICIDLDNSESTNNIPKELQDLSRSRYTELSPSGKGYHIWCKGTKPLDMGRVGHTSEGYKVEVFGNTGWVTVTGNTIFPASIVDDQPLIMHLYQTYFKNKQSDRREGRLMNPPELTIAMLEVEAIKEEMFKGPYSQQILSLWAGDMSNYNEDHSRADFALCRFLANYAEYDFMTIDTLFRESALYRKKWDERRGDTTYGARTIERAINLEYNGNYILETSDTSYEVDNEDQILQERSFNDELVQKGLNAHNETLNNGNDILKEIMQSNDEIKMSLLKQIRIQENHYQTLLNKLDKQEILTKKSYEQNSFSF